MRSLELPAEDAGRVTVHVLRPPEPELLELGRVAPDHAREVHHLGQAEHPVPAHQRLEVAGRERTPRRLEGGRGHARRGHEEDLELKARRGVVQPVDAVGAEHVRDLVRVGDDRGGAEREHEPCELVDEQLHRLEVHVRVDEARDDVSARRVDRLAALVRSDAGDRPVHDRDVGLEPLAREDGEHPPAAHDEVGGLVAPGDRESALELRRHAGQATCPSREDELALSREFLSSNRSWSPHRETALRPRPPVSAWTPPPVRRILAR